MKSDKYYENLTANEYALNFHVQIKEDILDLVVRSEVYVQSQETGQYNVERAHFYRINDMNHSCK